MTFKERLEGTPLEDDNRAWIICSVIDWCREVDVVTPTERDWCKILGCFPKGKARRGEEKKGLLPQNQVHSLLEQLDKEGVMSFVKGKGRKRNEVVMPEGKNLLADRKAGYEARKAEWKQRVWLELKEYTDRQTATLEDVKQFFDTYSVADENFQMLWENEKERSKRGHFYIKQRFVSWKKKRDAVLTKPMNGGVQTSTAADPQTYGKMDKQGARLFDEWLTTKGITHEQYDYKSMHEEWEQYQKDHS